MIRMEEDRLVRRFDKELLVVEAWGRNGLRVRATQRHAFEEDDGVQALLPRPKPKGVRIYEADGVWSIENGKIRAELTGSGKLRYYNQNGKLLLAEFQRTREMYEEGHREFNSALELYPRTFRPHPGMDNFELTARFEAVCGERIFGMGQYQQPYLDMKGCVLELAHRNSQASVPFALSSEGYGFLWNNPAIGSVVFGKNVTEWKASSAKQLDYWITAGDTPAEIEESYADVAGKVPMMPEYGLGFWQCKLRYKTQEEILSVAREYRRRGLPLDVIVVDFFHWPYEGDWTFDRDYWPDPKGMVEELKEMGIRLMVSIWPTVEQDSENYAEMKELGYLMRTEHGKRLGELGGAAVIDVTNADTRHYVWDKIRENYYKLGIRIFWLDEAEPELNGEPGYGGYEYEHYRYFRGADMEIGNIFPREYARMAYEGMQAEGQENIVNLLRCAWAGSQRYGALVWSGDIDSSFASLRNQLRAGLSMGIAGIPWWTTDIGGFHGGDIRAPWFREVFARWFAFGAFCPVMRLHGFREPIEEPMSRERGGKCPSGAANEVWTYGEEIYEICRRYLQLREAMRPYVRELMREAHEKGTPVMRPLFYDFPEDAQAWGIDDQYMFGPDLLVAPILYEGVTERELYLPEGSWRSLADGSIQEGGRRITVPAPLDILPVFARAGRLTELTLT
ncbi:glycoside hydrolase family 31 protein [Lachnoclostridium sp. Marseille-P6806]|uniref:glycoside hydrolase family 31 protein n=1 Tax=Lachnoclostridium sp. Marseille-P6806 TaxID=2364793 RepID=UPI00102FD8F1|nr:glycoside hydrolase family 31 protein [Lachnoclostridium sp. Marseille-P6806]